MITVVLLLPCINA